MSWVAPKNATPSVAAMNRPSWAGVVAAISSKLAMTPSCAASNQPRRRPKRWNGGSRLRGERSSGEKSGGDEDEAFCRQFDRPYIKAARVRPDVDLVQYARSFSSAQAILLDAFVEGYGGGGKVFDWTLIPPDFAKPLILSGGLDAGNVVDAIARVRPAAVDVSSGVEAARGIKDAEKIREFVSAVRSAGLMPID